MKDILELLLEDIKNYEDHPKAHAVFTRAYFAHLDKMPEGAERLYYEHRYDEYYRQREEQADGVK